MNQHQTRPIGPQVLVHIFVMSFVTMLGLTLVACGTTPEASAPLVSQIQTPTETTSRSAEFTSTNTPDSQDTNTTTGKDVFNTRVAQHLAGIATEAALSPHPTPPQGPIYLESPVPTRTPAPWQTGFIDCGVDMSAGGAVRTYNNCWDGIVNGYEVSIVTGREVDRPEGGGQCPTQGFWGIDAWIPGTDPYDHGPYDHVADREYAGCDGPLHIKSVSGSIVTFDGSAAFSVDISNLLPKPTPTP